MIRKHLGLSQEAFARILNVATITVNRWEQGHAIPTRLGIEKLERIEKEHGIKPKDK